MFSKLWPRSRPSTEVLAKALLEAHGGEGWKLVNVGVTDLSEKRRDEFGNFCVIFPGPLRFYMTFERDGREAKVTVELPPKERK